MILIFGMIAEYVTSAMRTTSLTVGMELDHHLPGSVQSTTQQKL